MKTYGKAFLLSSSGSCILFVMFELLFVSDFSNAFLLRSGDKSLVSAGFSEIHVFGIFWSVVALLHFKKMTLSHFLGFLSVSRAAFFVLTLDFILKLNFKRFFFIVFLLGFFFYSTFSVFNDLRLFKIIASTHINSVDLGYFSTGSGLGFRLQTIADKFFHGLNRPFAADLINPDFKNHLVGHKLLHCVVIALFVNAVLPFSVVLSTVFGFLPGYIVSLFIAITVLKKRLFIKTIIVSTVLLSVGPFYFWWLPISKDSFVVFGQSYMSLYGREYSTYSDIGWVFAVFFSFLFLKRRIVSHST